MKKIFNKEVNIFLGLVLLVFVIFYVADADANNSIILLAILAIGVTLISSGISKVIPNGGWKIFGATVFLVLEGFVVKHYFGRNQVLVDNFTPYKIYMKISDGDSYSQDARSTAVIGLRPGKRQIKVFEYKSDSLLQTLDVDVRPGKQYIFNVLNRAIYLSGEKHYAKNILYSNDFPPDEGELEVKGTWFENVYSYPLQDAPDKITIRTRGFSFNSTATRSYLRRSPNSFWPSEPTSTETSEE